MQIIRCRDQHDHNTEARQEQILHQRRQEQENHKNPGSLPGQRCQMKQCKRGNHKTHNGPWQQTADQRQDQHHRKPGKEVHIAQILIDQKQDYKHYKEL